jgi:hypothetical protein
VRERVVGGGGTSTDGDAVKRPISASWQKGNESKHSMSTPSSEVIRPRESRYKADLSFSKFQGGIPLDNKAKITLFQNGKSKNCEGTFRPRFNQEDTESTTSPILPLAADSLRLDARGRRGGPER